MNSAICEKSDNFPWSLCTSFREQVLTARNEFITFVIPTAFALGSFHVKFSESKSIPRTVPLVPTPKDFSREGQSAANGKPTFPHTSTYFAANTCAKLVDAGETIGTSSSWRCTMPFGTFVSAHTIFTTVSGIESKFAGADLLPKTVVMSKKYLPSQWNPKAAHCDATPATCL